jgi:hypothetical protein
MSAFPELVDGVAVWRAQVADPQHAGEAKCELGLRVLPYPQGGVLAVAMALYDSPGRPQFFHQCALAASPAALQWLASVQEQGGVKLIFERKGWVSDTERKLPVDAALISQVMAEGTAAPRAPGDGMEVLLAYIESYREALLRLKQPALVWDELCAAIKAPVPAARAAKPWGKILFWLALAAAVAAYFFLRTRP